MDFSIRLLLAIFAWLAAGFLAMNNIAANETALDAWWLPLLLTLLGAALLLIQQLRIGVTPEMESEAEAAITAAQPRLLLPVPDAAVAPIAETEPETPPAAEEAIEAAAASEGIAQEPEPEPVAPVEAEVEAEPEPEAEAEPETEDISGTPTPEPEPVSTSPQMNTTANRSVSQKTSERVQDDRPDDLTRIEGIGKKMSAALIAAGLDTFGKVAAASEDDLRAAIDAAGMRFSPSLVTWAKQASFAAQDDWDGLQAYQDTLTAGRPPDA